MIELVVGSRDAFSVLILGVCMPSEAFAIFVDFWAIQLALSLSAVNGHLLQPVDE